MAAPTLFFLRGRRDVLRCRLIALCLGLFIFVTSANVCAQDLNIAILSSDVRGVTLLLTAPEPLLASVPDTDGRWYQLEIPNVAVKQVLGQPALPQQGVLVAVPEAAHLTLTIEDVQFHEVSERAIAPSIPRQLPSDVPLWQHYDQYMDQGFYSQDALLPAAPVSIGFQGLLRDQAVAQIVFHPVLVNPAMQTLRIYRQLRVHVAFDRPLAVDAAASQLTAISGAGVRRGSHDPFATLMRETLINARQAGR